MQLTEDKYAGPFVKGGTTLSFTKPELTAALTTKTWHHLKIALNRTGYEIRLNGQLLASVPSADLNNWGRGQKVKLTLGNFDGWIDEVAVRNESPNATASATLTPLGAGPDGFRVQIAGQPGTSYVIQGSQNSKSWTNVGTVSLTTSTAVFIDTEKTSGYRLYRAVKQ
jgi:hypothetical protein